MFTLLLCSVGAVAVASGASLILAVKKAPQGYEDENGYHEGVPILATQRAMSGVAGKRARRANAPLVVSPPRSAL